MQNVDDLMRQALIDQVFPGGVLLVARGDEVLFFEAYGKANLYTGEPVVKNTVFDLASLTKPLATTPVIMKLIQDERLGLDQDLGSLMAFFKGTDKEHLTIEQLLRHTAGLPDYRPYFEGLRKTPGTVNKNALRKLLVKEPLLHTAGRNTLYSDLGFMLLEWVVEAITGERLDFRVSREVYQPMALEDLFFVDLEAAPREEKFAATEDCPWRNKLLIGCVHDDNAYAVGGIAGHAGLFGTTGDVFRLLRELLLTYHDRPATNLFHPEWVNVFFDRQPGSDRALGFDTPSAEGSSSGRHFSANSVGHLGFTGTSFWMDLDRHITVILLTNRVHPSRKNEKIKRFRPLLHDRVMENLI